MSQVAANCQQVSSYNFVRHGGAPKIERGVVRIERERRHEMRKIILLPLLAAFAGFLWGQSASVVSLTADDSSRVSAAWEQLQAAQKNWQEVQDSIEKTYLE